MPLILVAVQHTVDIGNILNWVQKIVFHVTCNGQLKPLTVVLKYRPFVFVEFKVGVAVSTVCYLYLTNPLCLQTLYSYRWKAN